MSKLTGQEISALDLLRLSRLMFEEARRLGECGDAEMFSRAAQGRALLAEGIDRLTPEADCIDPTPYCSYGHPTKASCDCGPIAENE